jgi:hypothetical protein
MSSTIQVVSTRLEQDMIRMQLKSPGCFDGKFLNKKREVYIVACRMMSGRDSKSNSSTGSGLRTGAGQVVGAAVGVPPGQRPRVFLGPACH